MGPAILEVPDQDIWWLIDDIEGCYEGEDCDKDDDHGEESGATRTATEGRQAEESAQHFLLLGRARVTAVIASVLTLVQIASLCGVGWYQKWTGTEGWEM